MPSHSGFFRLPQQGIRPSTSIPFLSFSSLLVLPSHGSRRDRSLANCSNKSHVTILLPAGNDFVRKIDSFRNVTKVNVRETCVSLGQFLYRNISFRHKLWTKSGTYLRGTFQEESNLQLTICIDSVYDARLFLTTNFTKKEMKKKI